MFPNNEEQKENTEILEIDTEVQSDKENTCDTPPEIVTIGTSDQEPETAWDQQESDWSQRNDDSQDGSKDCSDCDRTNDASLWPKYISKWVEFVVSSMKAEDVDDNSPSRLEWLRQKRDENERNVYLDQLMTMVGLENVKAHFLAVKAKFKAGKQAHAGHKLRLHLVLHGKDGTGKSSQIEETGHKTDLPRKARSPLHNFTRSSFFPLGLWPITHFPGRQSFMIEMAMTITITMMAVTRETNRQYVRNVEILHLKLTMSRLFSTTFLVLTQITSVIHGLLATPLKIWKSLS